MSLSKCHAKRLLQQLKISALPIDPYGIAKQKEIEVSEDDSEGYSGMLLLVNKHALISVRKTIREYQRKRFTVAHELGHYTIPGHLTSDKPFFKCTDKDLNTFWELNSKESEANSFAAELLMPENHFKDRINGKDLSYNVLQDLKAEFDTSLTATAIRFIEISGEYALIRSEKGAIKSFFRGEEFPYYVRDKGPLDENSMAIEFFNGENIPTTIEAVPAECWLDDYRIKGDLEVQELSIALPYYNEVLTFLYVDDYNIDDEDEYLEELDGYPKFRK